jgi:hypothetical protein
MYYSETWEKAFERLEQRASALDAAWLSDPQDALAQMSFTLMAILTEVAAEHDLSLTQLRVLGILRDREPTMADLATFTGLERSTISGLVPAMTAGIGDRITPLTARLSTG